MEHPKKLIDLCKEEDSILELRLKKDTNITVDFIIKKTFAHSTLKLLARNVYVVICDGTLKLRVRMDRPFIHQISSRMFPNEKFWSGCLKKWLVLFDRHTKREVNLTNEIKNILVNEELVIRYYPNKDDDDFNTIYGIVSKKYKPSSQLNFRELLIKNAENKNLINNSSRSYLPERKDYIEEVFTYIDKPIGLNINISVVYGKNTGYNSYKFIWNRYTIEQEKGQRLWFIPHQSQINFEWRNNSKSTIEEFVQIISEEGNAHRVFLEEKIALSKDIDLDIDFADFVNLRFLIANATKEKIIKKCNDYAKKFGRTVYAFSCGLRDVGNDKWTYPGTKKIIIESGTKLIEDGMDEILYSKTPIKLMGNYNYEKYLDRFK